MKRVERQFIPPRLRAASSYKHYLRVDFRYSCAYCTRHEAENGGYHNFDVDHFRPLSLFPHLATAYSNLYYSCRKCNNVKSNNWPTKRQQQQGFRFVDPCADQPTDHFLIWYATNGLYVDVKSKPGSYTVEHLRLRWRTDIAELHKLRYTQKQRLLEIKDYLHSLINILSTKAIQQSDRERLLAGTAILRKYLLHLRKAVSGNLDPPY